MPAYHADPSVARGLAQPPTEKVSATPTFSRGTVLDASRQLIA